MKSYVFLLLSISSTNTKALIVFGLKGTFCIKDYIQMFLIDVIKNYCFENKLHNLFLIYYKWLIFPCFALGKPPSFVCIYYCYNIIFYLAKKKKSKKILSSYKKKKIKVKFVIFMIFISLISRIFNVFIFHFND